MLCFSVLCRAKTVRATVAGPCQNTPVCVIFNEISKTAPKSVAIVLKSIAKKHTVSRGKGKTQLRVLSVCSSLFTVKNVPSKTLLELFSDLMGSTDGLAKCIRKAC